MMIKALALYQREPGLALPVVYRGQPLTVGSDHQALVDACCRALHDGPGRGFATFVEGEAPALRPGSDFTFASWAEAFVAAFAAWCSEVETEVLAAPVILLCLQQQAGGDHLLIVLAEQRNGFTLTADLQLLEIQSLAVDRGLRVLELALAHRGDEPVPPVRYAGRSGRKVADPLFSLLGLERDEQAVDAGIKVARSIEAVCTAQGLPAAEQMAVKQQVSRLCRERFADGDVVRSDELSELVSELTGKPVSSAIFSEQGIDSDAFMAAPIGFRKGSRFAGAGRGMSVSFDRALLGNAVHFDAASGSLTLTNLPANLIDQLLKAQSQPL